MVPLYGLALEDKRTDYREYRKGETFLDDFELHKGEGPAVDVGPQTVGGNHDQILEKGYAPGEEYYGYERPVV